MQPIIYDVAVSIDGFISGPDGNISAFPSEGQILDDHLCRLAAYRTVIMGRGTYELGYRFGLWPGANPYPKARTIVFSRTMELPQGASVELRRDLRACDLDALKDEADGPIYLCGGGSFAAQVRNMGRLDQLRLKRANIVLGGGTPLFAGLQTPLRLSLVEERSYGNGLIFQDFAVRSGTP